MSWVAFMTEFRTRTMDRTGVGYTTDCMAFGSIRRSTVSSELILLITDYNHISPQSIQLLRALSLRKLMQSPPINSLNGNGIMTS